MTRHDNVDAAALAGCNRSLVQSSTLAVLPPQEKHANRALTLGPDGKLCECLLGSGQGSRFRCSMASWLQYVAARAVLPCLPPLLTFFHCGQPCPACTTSLTAVQTTRWLRPLT